MDYRDMVLAAESQATSHYAMFTQVNNYIKGNHSAPYSPKGIQDEYTRLVARSVVNLMNLVIKIPAQHLRVDGFRSNGESVDDAWSLLNEHRFRSMQTAIHRGALAFGAHYVVVLPIDGGIDVRHMSARDIECVYSDSENEFPDFGVFKRSMLISGRKETASFVVTSDGIAVLDPDYTIITRYEFDNGLDECPIVRYRSEIPLSSDDEPVGEIYPLIASQDRLNDTTFSLSMAQAYSSFRQRWATGLGVEKDESGNPIEPFKTGVDRLFYSEDSETRFGEFGQTSLDGLLASQNAGIDQIAMLSQLPTHHLIGKIQNVGADALEAADVSLSRKIADLRDIVGDSHMSLARLVLRIYGKPPMPADTEPHWRDTSSRSIAQLADALGKLASQLGIPVEALWPMLPWVTRQDISDWSKLKAEASTLPEMTIPSGGENE